MSNNTQPRFEVGQKIAAKEKTFAWKKGQEFIVRAVTPGCCAAWWVDIGLLNMGRFDAATCRFCKRDIEIGLSDPLWFGENNFYPIEPTHADITKELATEPVEERLDVPKINEPILS